MKRYLVALVGISAIMALVVAGCGGSSSNGTSSSKDLFVESCGSCHVLKAAGTSGKVGPSLDKKKSSKSKIEKQIKDGSKGMPAGLLSGEDATKVTDYVSSEAGK